MTNGTRELPLVRHRIEALLSKVEASVCTPDEAGAALAKARELAGRYGLDWSLFRWPAAASGPAGLMVAVDRAPEGLRRAPRRGDIGRLCMEPIAGRPDWADPRIAEEARIGCSGRDGRRLIRRPQQPAPIRP